MASSSPSSSRRVLAVIAAVPVAFMLVIGGAAAPAAAAEAAVGLGVAGSYAVLGGATVTNTGGSVLTGNLGVSPGSAITGFPPGLLVSGVKHAADVEAAAARAAFTTAYGDAAGRSPSVVGLTELANMNLVPGVYSGGALQLSGTLTLTGGADDVFIFQATSTLITASASVVSLVGVSACNVFWQVGSSATLGSNSSFVGTVLASASITANSTAVVSGRLLAGTGQVSLINNAITRPAGCDVDDDDKNGDGVVDADDGDTDGDGDVDATDGDTDLDGDVDAADGDLDADGDVDAIDRLIATDADAAALQAAAVVLAAEQAAAEQAAADAADAAAAVLAARDAAAAQAAIDAAARAAAAAAAVTEREVAAAAQRLADAAATAEMNRAAGAPRTDRLAFTGSDPTAIGVLAGVLMLVGVPLLLARRFTPTARRH